MDNCNRDVAPASGRMLRAGGWYWFLSGKEEALIPEKCGKWMYFFMDQNLAIEICKKAIVEDACFECKCSDLDVTCDDTGVICFYLNGDDMNSHKAVLSFMLRNNLIPRTKTGRLYNISFKFDVQTRAGEYGAGFEGKIKLAQFVDLETGDWLK